MLAILIALVLLLAGVASIYLLVKKMSDDGIDIAPPGSCRRGRCGIASRPPVEEAEPVPLQTPEADDQRKLNS